MRASRQWVPDEQVDEWLTVPANRTSFENELADVFAYLLQLADRTGTDLETALTKKVALNEQRYPVERSRSSTTKYDAL